MPLKPLRNDGDVLSSLYPFRESFYERLGYVTFPQSRQAIFKPAAMAPLLQDDLGGEVELCLMGEGYDAYNAYVTEMQPGVHGMAMFVDFDRPERSRPEQPFLAGTGESGWGSCRVDGLQPEGR